MVRGTGDIALGFGGVREMHGGVRRSWSSMGVIEPSLIKLVGFGSDDWGGCFLSV